VSWKLSRTVLRGGTTRKVGPLLDVRTGKAKQPYCFKVNDGELFAFAGLWDRWKDPSGNWVKTCSILTTTPNAITGAVHDRMPVILSPDSYDRWLDPGLNDVSMASFLVSARVNSVANDDEECSAPVEPAQISIDCSHRTVGLSMTCDSQDLTFHTVLLDGVAVRQDSW
jgi:hypothetical protein